MIEPQDFECTETFSDFKSETDNRSQVSAWISPKRDFRSPIPGCAAKCGFHPITIG